MKSLVFNDFDAFAASIEDAELRCTLSRLDRAFWSLLQCEIGGIHVQLGVEGSPAIVEGAVHRAGCALFFELDARGESRANGAQLERDSVFLMNPGAEFCVSNSAGHSWCSIFIPNELMPSVPFRTARVIPAGRDAIVELRTLVGGLVSAAALDASVLTEPASQIGFQSSVERFLRTLLADPGEQTFFNSGRPAIDRKQLIKQVSELVEDSPVPRVSVESLAESVDVSDRTLRNVFDDYFGVSPRRYLQLRRLHHARQALREADDRTKVSEVAARFGFWDFGRFSGRYRTLFGELPSETLRHAF